jgi:predicted GNAT family acetyltransferase
MNNAASTDDSAMRRYPLIVDSREIGFIQYYLFSHVAIVTHTEIAQGHEGKGYGAALAQQALDYFRSEGRQVVPVCGFFAAYLRTHAEYADLVTPACRHIFAI